MSTTCCTCDERRFPPEPAAEGWEPYTLSGAGTIYSFTVVRQPSDGYEERSPAILALVTLAEGPRITAQLTDCDADQVAIDMPVEMVTRRLRDWFLLVVVVGKVAEPRLFENPSYRVQWAIIGLMTSAVALSLRMATPNLAVPVFAVALAMVLRPAEYAHC